jgi:hypothetical protein
MKAMKNRVRYLVARAGWSTRVMAWEFFGECNLMPGFKVEEGAAWHREMAQFTMAQDLKRHLVFTHCNNWQKMDAIWNLPEITCVQGNGYIRPPNRTPDHIVNFDNYLSEVAAFKKPTFVAEYGGRSELGAPNEDYLEAQLHSGLWASLVMPFAGMAAQWWWNYVDAGDRYFHYAAISAFCSGIDRLKFHYKTITPRLEAKDLRVRGMQAEDRGFYWIYHPEIFVRYQDLPTIDGAVLHLEGLKAGNYRVTMQRCDQIKGEEQTVPLPGSIKLPSIRRDLAIRVEPVT